jgi:hypothetical protein
VEEDLHNFTSLYCNGVIQTASQNLLLKLRKGNKRTQKQTTVRRFCSRDLLFNDLYQFEDDTGDKMDTNGRYLEGRASEA